MQADEHDELARAIADGSPVDVLVVLVSKRLRSLARRMFRGHREIRRIEDTDDLLQNAAIRLKRAFTAEKIESPRAAMALAVVQLKRELIDLYRRNRREFRYRDAVETCEGDLAQQLPADIATNDSDLSAWTTFHEAVEALPSDQREAVHFLWYLGLDQAAAAKLLCVSDRTLRRNWRQARTTLRERLGDLDFGG